MSPLQFLKTHCQVTKLACIASISIALILFLILSLTVEEGACHPFGDVVAQTSFVEEIAKAVFSDDSKGIEQQPPDNSIRPNDTKNEIPSRTSEKMSGIQRTLKDPQHNSDDLTSQLQVGPSSSTIFSLVLQPESSHKRRPNTSESASLIFTSPPQNAEQRELVDNYVIGAPANEAERSHTFYYYYQGNLSGRTLAFRSRAPVKSNDVAGTQQRSVQKAPNQIVLQPPSRMFSLNPNIGGYWRRNLVIDSQYPDMLSFLHVKSNQTKNSVGDNREIGTIKRHVSPEEIERNIVVSETFVADEPPPKLEGGLRKNIKADDAETVSNSAVPITATVSLDNNGVVARKITEAPHYNEISNKDDDDDDDGDKDFAEALQSTGEDDLLRMLGILRRRPTVSESTLKALKELGARASSALEYAIHHPEGPEYHEVKIRNARREAYVETHIVSLPEEFGGEKNLCRLSLNIDSPVFKLSPFINTITSSLFRTAVLSVSTDVRLAVVSSEFLPTYAIQAEGPCQGVLAAIRSFTRSIGDYSMSSFFDHAVFKDAETRIISYFFGRFIREASQKAEEVSASDLKLICDQMMNAVSSYPFFLTEKLVEIQNITESDVERYAELARQFLSMAISNARVSVVAVGHFGDDSEVSKNRILEWSEGVGSDLQFSIINITEYLDTFRKVQLPSLPYSVVFEKKVGLSPGQKITSVVGILYQIFEEDVIGLKRHSCKDLLLLDSIASIGRSLGRLLVSSPSPTSTESLPNNPKLWGTKESGVISSIDISLTDIYEDVLFLNIKAASTVARSELVETELMKFMEYLETILRTSSNDELKKLLSNWSPDYLLFAEPPVSSFTILADFYCNQVRSRTYDFERPTECLEAFNSLTDMKAAMVTLWDKFFSGSATTRMIKSRIDTYTKSAEPSLVFPEEISHSYKETPPEVIRNQTKSNSTSAILKNVEDAVNFVRSRSLLPLRATISSIIVHERFLRGWENETVTTSQQVTTTISPITVTQYATTNEPLKTIHHPGLSSKLSSPTLTFIVVFIEVFLCRWY